MLSNHSYRGNSFSLSKFLQGIVTLFQNPSQLQDLKANPSLAPLFVEELCRYHTASAMATRRVAKVDVMLGDKVRTIPISLNRLALNIH